jgi:protein-disulfide isomerase/mono/diheme cytochrome c family protein
MRKQKSHPPITTAIGFGLLICFSLALPVQAGSRWYDQSSVDQGASLFKQNCASCHGQNGEATANWKEVDANGNYSPPPLNGTAHAWHHSKDLLKRTILEGGAKIGGVMPGFKGRLSEGEIDAVISYFQSKWPDQVYSNWAKRNKVSDTPAIDNATETSAQAMVVKKDEITKLLKLRLKSDSVSEPIETPVANIYQTQFGKNYAYLTGNGRYLFMADLIDLEQEQNLTNNAKGNIETPAPKPLTAEITGNPDTREMTDLLKLRLGSNVVSEPVKTPVGGIYQASFGINFAYLTEDGRYVFMGNLIDLERRINLTEMAKRKIVKKDLEVFATEDKAIFPATGPEKAVVNIFTDTSCVACRKLFLEVPKLQAAGISVQYLPFPDEGLNSPGYKTLKQVWCSADKAKALTIGKGVEQGTLPAGNCADGKLVDTSYALGKTIGVFGTPAIFKENGAHIKGYVSYQKLIPMVLDQ